MKTRFYTLSVILCLFVSSSSWAQESHSGIKGGLNLSNMTINDNNDENLKVGFHAGVFDKIAITDRFAIQPEFLYSVKGLKINYDQSVMTDGQSDFNLNYLDLPVKLVFNLADDFDFQFGPYVSYLVNAHMSTDAQVLDYFNIDSEDDIDRKNFHALDYGLSAGLGFELDPLVLGFNYNLGLAPVAKKDESAYDILGDAKNTVIQVYVGMYF